MSTFFALVVSALGCALNTALYVASGSPWSIGGAIFCGIFTVFNLAMLVDES